jgi:hypothetical protein
MYFVQLRIARINDRGPFHPGRVIDLSWSAAAELGYTQQGSARVRVEAITPEQMASASPGIGSNDVRVDTGSIEGTCDGNPDRWPVSAAGILFRTGECRGFRGRVAMELGELVPAGGLVLQTATGGNTGQRQLYRGTAGPLCRSQRSRTDCRSRQAGAGA